MPLVNTDRNLITVTGDTQLGAGSTDYSDTTFLITGSTDSLRFITDNTATYTRCNFYEGENCLAFGAENFRHKDQDSVDGNTTGERSRFNTEWATTSNPTFRGCTFTMQNSSRSDFDISQTPAQPEVTFEYDEFGTPCRILIDSAVEQQCNFGSQFLHIDGLIIDNRNPTGGLCMAFAYMNADPDYIKNLEVVDNDPGSLDPHVGFLVTQMMPTGEFRQIRGLKARNVALMGADSSTNVRTLKLLDPIGRIQKATGPSIYYYYGQLEVYRTIGTSLYDAVTLAPLTGRIVHKDSTDSVIGDIVDVAGFTKVMHQFTQPVNSLTVNTDNQYSETIAVYGYNAQSRDFTIDDEDTVDALIKPGTYFFADENITQTDRSIVNAYTTINNANELYDGLANLSYKRTDDIALVGQNIVSPSGTILDFGDKDVHIDPTIPQSVMHYPASYSSTFSEFTIFNSYEAGSRTVEWQGLTYSELDNGNGWTDLRVYNVIWKPDGTLFFIVAVAYGVDAGHVMARYSCSTPWDMSTAVQDEWKKWTMWGNVGAVSISPDGLKITWGNEGGRWYYTNLYTAWSITGPAAWLPGFGTILSFAGGNNHGAHTWNADGTELTTCSHGRTDGLLELSMFTCSTAYDADTATLSTTHTISSNIANDAPEGLAGGAEPNRKDNVGGVQWIDSGNWLSVFDGRNGNILLFSAGTAYDITTVGTYSTADVFINGPSYEETGSTYFAPTWANDKLYYGSIKPIAGGGTAFEIASYPLIAISGMAGLPNKVYINSASLETSNQFDTLKTTGYITSDNGANIGMQVIDASGTYTTVTINGINPGTEVRMYRKSDDSEIAGVENSTGTEASLGYLFTVEEETYIVIHNVQYTTSPRYIEFTTQSTPASLTVFQQIDRGYSNPV